MLMNMKKIKEKKNRSAFGELEVSKDLAKRRRRNRDSVCSGGRETTPTACRGKTLVGYLGYRPGYSVGSMVPRTPSTEYVS